MKDFASKYREKAEELKKDKKFEESLKFTDKALAVEKEAKSADYWYKRGRRFSEIGEYENALDCYEKDLVVHDKSYDVFFEKGRILIQLKRFADAVESFNKAAETRNQNYLQSSKKVEHLKKARKFEKALMYTDFAVNEKPLDENFWYYKGIALLKLKKFDDASTCFKSALDIKNDEKFLYEIAKCELFSGNEEKTIEFLRKASKMNPTIREKLKVDSDFSKILENKQFRVIVGL